MAEWPGIYATGTATVAAGGTAVTLQGAGNLVQAVRPGDRFGSHVGRPIRITSVAADKLTLAYPWPGPTQTAAPYEISFTPYDGGYRQALQTLLDRYGGGGVAALAELALSADQLLYSNGPGSLALSTFTALGRNLVAADDVNGVFDGLGLSDVIKDLLHDKDTAEALATLKAEGALSERSIVELASQISEAGQREIALYGGAGKTGKGQIMRDAGVSGTLRLNNPDGAAQVLGKSGYGVTVHEDGAVSAAKNPLLVANRNAGQEVLSQGFNYGVLPDSAGQIVANVGGWTFANPGNGYRGRAAYVPKAGHYRLSIRTYFYANMGGRRVTLSRNGATTNIFCQATGNNEGNLMAQNIMLLAKGDQLGFYISNADVTVYTGNGHTELTAEWIGELAA